MTSGGVRKQRDRAGRLRYYIDHIESRAGFANLVTFVSQELNCKFSELDEGPGTLVQRALVEGAEIVFVLSDATGTQFYAASSDGEVVAERIAATVENRMQI